jgi:hypothetical protein
MSFWVPHKGPQEEALKQPDDIFEILFGGSRGPGKTDAGLVWLTDPIDNPLYRGLVIRRNADDLSDWVDRAGRMYHNLGVNIAYRPAILSFPSGAVIRTGHLKDEQAYTKYQGHEYQRILIEELTQIPNEKRYLQLLGSLRSTVEGIRPQAFLTTNPGGVGHGWVKQRFIDNIPPNQRYVDPTTGMSRIFIPATIDDNPTLIKSDPNYVMFLESLKETDPDLWKAWRLGDWDIFAGQAFREFRQQIHVIDPSRGYTFEFPLSSCRRVLAFDWGYNAPGCAIWIAIAPENKLGVQHIYIYRELYQREKHPEEWANDLRIINTVDPVKFIYMPHDTFNRESGESISEIFRRIGGLRVVKGDTLVRGARRNRLALTHRALAISPDGMPYMLIHPNCRNLIRTLPSLVYAENNPEDIDTEGEDHAYDAMSLGLLMTAPTFGTSGGVTPIGTKGAQFPGRTFTPTKSGAMQAPDFWDGFKVDRKPTRWHK